MHLGPPYHPLSVHNVCGREKMECKSFLPLPCGVHRGTGWDRWLLVSASRVAVSSVVCVCRQAAEGVQHHCWQEKDTS